MRWAAKENGRMRKVTLSEIEQYFAVLTATKRHNLARERGRTNGKIGPQDDFMTDLLGIGGEIAVAKVLNAYPDIDWTAGTDTGAPDLTLKNGVRLDVKTTTYKSGKLLVKKEYATKTNIDYYVLVIAAYPVFRLAGYAAPTQIFLDNNLHDFGHGFAYALEQEEIVKFQ
jgi:hypothetical protein